MSTLTRTSRRRCPKCLPSSLRRMTPRARLGALRPLSSRLPSTSSPTRASRRRPLPLSRSAGRVHLATLLRRTSSRRWMASSRSTRPDPTDALHSTLRRPSRPRRPSTARHRRRSRPTLQSTSTRSRRSAAAATRARSPTLSLSRMDWPRLVRPTLPPMTAGGCGATRARCQTSRSSRSRLSRRRPTTTAASTSSSSPAARRSATTAAATATRTTTADN